MLYGMLNLVILLYIIQYKLYDLLGYIKIFFLHLARLEYKWLQHLEISDTCEHVNVLKI